MKNKVLLSLSYLAIMNSTLTIPRPTKNDKKLNKNKCIQRSFGLNNLYLAVMDIVRSWREQKIMLKRRFPVLSDEDFLFEQGNRENMLIKLAMKLNKSRLELELLFAELQTY